MQNMEGKTHYDRVIGGTAEEKEIALRELQSSFDERSERMRSHELEKTPEDLQVIQQTESMVDEMVQRYGGDSKPLPLDHIYILKPNSVIEMTDGKLGGGIHQPFGAKIGVEKKESKLLLASTIAHEMFHLKSYKSARVGNSDEDARLYRSGLSMFDRKNFSEASGEEKEYFAMLEEAIVAECTKKFLDKISGNDLFCEEAEAVEKIKNWVSEYYRRSGMPEEKIQQFADELKFIADPVRRVEEVMASSDDEQKRQEYAAGMLHGFYDKGEVEPMERWRERKMMYDMLDDLVAKSNGRFKGRDKAFDEFAKANFTGDYLSLARIVEGILGKGSFRRLAEAFSREADREKHETSESANF